MLIYWTKRHENYCLQWLSANTSQQYYLYKKLLPALNQMAEIIANRYFSIPFARQQEFYKEVLQDVFLRLPQYQSEKGSAYSFCSMCIKHQFYYLVTKSKNVTEIQLEYVDTYDGCDTSEPMYEQKQEIDVDKVFNELQARRNKVIQTVRQEKDSERSITKLHAEQLIQTLDMCIEYVHRFKDFDSVSLKEYCMNNSLMSEATISQNFTDLFSTKTKRHFYVKKPAKTPEEKSEYQRNYRKTHVVEMAKHNHKWYVKRGKKLQQDRRIKIKNERINNNGISTNATGINGSSNTELLHSIPINTGTKNKVSIGIR